MGSVGIVNRAHLLEGQVEIGRMVGAAEHEMFHQVCQTCTGGVFIARTHAIDDGASGQRRGVVLMNQHV